MSSKKVSQIFKILFQTGNTNIFVRHGVLFSRYVQLKSSFSVSKNISVGIETKFGSEAIKVIRGKALKENPITDRS